VFVVCVLLLRVSVVVAFVLVFECDVHVGRVIIVIIIFNADTAGVGI